MTKTKDPHRYDDLLTLPYQKSARHPHMSMDSRAAQFAPFAALTGHEEAIRETGRDVTASWDRENFYEPFYD